MKTRKNLKKVLSLALAILMITSVSSVTSLASDEANESENYIDFIDSTQYGDDAYMIRGNTTSFLYGTGNTYDLEIDEESYYAFLYYQMYNMYGFYTRDVNTIVLDEDVTSVGALKFFSYTNVDYLYLPNSLTYIGDYAFSSRYRTKNIDIPSSVEHIGKYAFASIKDTLIHFAEEYEPDENADFSNVEDYLGASKITIYSKNCVIEENAFSKETVIHGYAGSTAEAYAKSNGNEFVVLDENKVEPNWTWEFEDEYVCTESNRLIGKDESTGEEVILSVEANPHYDADGDSVCDICDSEIPSFFEFFISIIKTYIDAIKTLLGLFLPF